MMALCQIDRRGAVSIYSLSCFVQRLETKGLSLVHLELTNTNLLNKNDIGGAPLSV